MCYQINKKCASNVSHSIFLSRIVLFCQFYFISLSWYTTTMEATAESQRLCIYIQWNQMNKGRNARSYKPIICFARPHIFLKHFIFSFGIVHNSEKKHKIVSNSMRKRSNSECWYIFVLCAFFTRKPVSTHLHSHPNSLCEWNIWTN